MIRLFRFGANVEHDDFRAEPDFVRRNLGHVDVRQFSEPLAELLEARLHQALSFECGFVLAVLAEVAHLDGATNLRGERDVQLVAEFFGFSLQF
ncbi:hypothetical protein D3C83_85860 [compost metagenome]